ACRSHRTSPAACRSATGVSSGAAPHAMRRRPLEGATPLNALRNRHSVRPECRRTAAVYRGAAHTRSCAPRTATRYAGCAGYSTRTVWGWLLGTVLLLGSAGGAAADPATAKPVGDAERGRLAFAPCRTCHYPEQGYGHHNGPSLWNVFGRQAGTAEGYAYY